MIRMALALIVATGALASAQPVPVPDSGRFYHGCYPGGVTGEEDDITALDVQNYEDVVGQKADWVYFSNNWYADRRFPAETAGWIRNRGAVPYIRLMLRSEDHKPGKPEKQ